jgi:hypothetical protein
MSKISIVADDTCVTVDGVGKVFAMDNFPADVHAVHYDTLTSSGHVEYKDIFTQNEDITSLSDYQAYVDVWNATKTFEEIENDEYEAMMKEHNDKIDKEVRERHEAMTYVEKREELYVAMGNQYEMMYDDAKNGTTIWQDSIDAIKVKIPKEWTPPAWDTLTNDDGTPLS